MKFYSFRGIKVSSSTHNTVAVSLSSFRHPNEQGNLKLSCFGTFSALQRESYKLPILPEM